MLAGRGSPDVMMIAQKLFVNGDEWHSNRLKRKGQAAISSAPFCVLGCRHSQIAH